MSKADLKAAMESLQVRKPLKLQGRQPQFKPPEPISEPTPVPLETLVAPPTPVEATTPVPWETTVPTDTLVPVPTEVAPQTPVSTATQVAPETTVPIHTLVDLPTQVAPPTLVPVETTVSEATPVTPPTPVPKSTQVSTATPVVAKTKVASSTHVAVEEGLHHSASGQDSSVTLEAQTASKLHHGYTRVPNSFLMRMAAGDLVRSEMQILLLIARFTISFQRRHAPLSKAVLERQSGLRGPAVLQAVSDLLAKGLIEKIPGDQHRPNQLGLAFTDEWDFFPKPRGAASEATSAPPATPVPTKTQVAVETTVAGKTPVATETSAPVAPPTPAGVAGATHFKERETIENKNSLSQLPKKLRDYFAELKPAKKRDSEWNAFRELQAEYSEKDIADCLALVQDRGIGSGEHAQPCHSPMAFLAKAIAEVMPEVEIRRQKVRERAERERREAEAQRKRADEEAREAAEWAAKERAFDRAFPGEERKREALAELLQNLPFRPHTQAGKIMAIGRWWDGLKQSERMEMSQ